MAFIGRKQPAATPTQERPKPRPSGPAAQANNTNDKVGRARNIIRDISAELKKVTWPTREETRNLTIVVIGITAVIGSILGALDGILSYLYSVIHP